MIAFSRPAYWAKLQLHGAIGALLLLWRSPDPAVGKELSMIWSACIASKDRKTSLTFSTRYTTVDVAKCCPHGEVASISTSVNPRTSMGTLFAVLRLLDEWFMRFIATSRLYTISAGMTVICAPESATASNLNTMGPRGDSNRSLIGMRGSGDGAGRPR
jgi:hypothetical protein